MCRISSILQSITNLFFILSVYSSFACHRNCHRSTVPASTRLRLQIDLILLSPFPMFVSCKQLMTLWCTTKRAALKQHKFSSPRLLFVRPFFFRLLELCSSTTESERVIKGFKIYCFNRTQSDSIHKQHSRTEASSDILLSVVIPFCCRHRDWWKFIARLCSQSPTLFLPFESQRGILFCVATPTIFTAPKLDFNVLRYLKHYLSFFPALNGRACH